MRGKWCLCGCSRRLPGWDLLIPGLSRRRLLHPEVSSARFQPTPARFPASHVPCLSVLCYPARAIGIDLGRRWSLSLAGFARRSCRWASGEPPPSLPPSPPPPSTAAPHLEVCCAPCPCPHVPYISRARDPAPIPFCPCAQDDATATNSSASGAPPPSRPPPPSSPPPRRRTRRAAAPVPGPVYARVCGSLAGSHFRVLWTHALVLSAFAA